MDKVLLCGYIVAALAAANSLTWKMGNDQAVFAVVAQAILDGGVPYRDAWDVKGPLIYYIYAFALWAWDRPALSIRIFDLIAVVTCCLTIRRLGSSIAKDSTFADFVALCFALGYFSLGYWNTAQPDGWAAMVLVGIILLMLDPPWSASISMAVIGALIGIIALINPVFSAYLALPIAFPCLNGTSSRHQFRNSGICIAAYVATVGAVAVALVNAVGLQEIVDLGHFLVAHVSRRTALNALGAPFFKIYIIPVALAVVGVVILYRSKKRRLAQVIVLWAAICLFTTSLQGKYFPYHLIPFLVALNVPMATAIFAVAPAGRAMIAVLALAPLAISALYSRDSSAAYEGSQAAIANYLMDQSDSSEKILVWAGELMPVYEIARRRPPTKFSFSYPMFGESEVKAKYRRIFMQQIASNPPCYVIFDSEYGRKLLAEFAEFNALLNENFHPVRVIASNEIWKRKDGCHNRAYESREIVMRPYAWGPFAR